MTDREKLIGLLNDFPVLMDWRDNDELADHLIANGVTIGKDTNVPSKWMPLPEPPKEVEDNA